MRLRRIVSAILLLIFATSVIPTVHAYGASPDEAVSIMHEYGFFRGTDNGFELDRTPTRMEAVIMAVRIGNLERGVLSGNWHDPKFAGTHNFTDVSDWEYGYVTCAVNSGLINGISETEFGGNMLVTAGQYVTMLLRALGYDDSYGNFSSDSPFELSDYIGLTDGSYPKLEGFTRRDMVSLAYKALRTNIRNSSMNLYYYSFVYYRIPLQEFPEVFQSENANILVHPSGNLKLLSVGETCGGGFGYIGSDERIMNIEADPLMLRIEEIEYNTADGGLFITYTALKPGKTCIKATYADDYGEPYSIAFINVYVTEAVG